MGYNVAHNLIGTLTNALLASAPGKEIHPQILRTLAIYGGQVERDTHSLPSKGQPPINERALPLRPGATKDLKHHFILPLSEIILIMYHLLPYNASDAPDASNGRSDNNPDPKHILPGNNNTSDNPSNNHVRCNDCNTDRILPSDNIN